MPYYSEPCSMYELMEKRLREGEGRVYQACIDCKGDNPCYFYDKQEERMARRTNGNNGSQPKVTIETRIAENMPMPKPKQIPQPAAGGA